LTIVLATASSDAVLPQIMRKLERLGVKDSVVGLVIPTGYSFNLDAFSIYLTLAVVFIAQATNTQRGALYSRDLSVDWFIGMARALGNLIGNCVATVVVAAWEGDLDRDKAVRVLDGEELVDVTAG
jgi:aerobic C4-dicarboxylate transport protein